MIEVIIGWLMDHSPWAGGAMGVGGAGAWLGKTFADRKQNKELESLKTRLKILENLFSKIEGEQRLNQQKDKNLKNKVDDLLGRFETIQGAINTSFLGGLKGSK